MSLKMHVQFLVSCAKKTNKLVWTIEHAFFVSTVTNKLLMVYLSIDSNLYGNQKHIK